MPDADWWYLVLYASDEIRKIVVDTLVENWPEETDEIRVRQERDDYLKALRAIASPGDLSSSAASGMMRIARDAIDKYGKEG